jgi:virulence-associated protein VagC
MRAATAKVINIGRFHAIRLPKDFWVKSSSVRLSKTASGFVVSEVIPSARHLKAFKALAGSCPDFPKIAANASRNVRRDWE